MKAPDGDHVDCMLARKDTWASDGQAGMSTGCASGEKCEYRRQM